VPISILDAYTSVSIKYKRNKTCYREAGSVTGFDVGTGNELFCIYDKAYERVRSCKYSKKTSITNTVTRFEARLKNQKIPFKSIHQLKEYLEYYPFSNLVFYGLKDELPQRLEGAKDFAYNFGMNSLVKKLSSGNNFKKTYLKWFEETPIEEQLRTKYFNSIRNQIGDTL
jgi:hypothetical protein